MKAEVVYTGLSCECCGCDTARLKKYPGIGYWCDVCMYDGCFSDDMEAANPSGPWPEFKKQPDGRYLTDRMYANHLRIREALDGRGS